MPGTLDVVLPKEVLNTLTHLNSHIMSNLNTYCITSYT